METHVRKPRSSLALSLKQAKRCRPRRRRIETHGSPDVARGPYGDEFTRMAIISFQRSDMLQSAFLADEELREHFINFVFGRGIRAAQIDAPR